VIQRQHAVQSKHRIAQTPEAYDDSRMGY